MIPIEQFRSFIKQHNLFEADDKILLAVSGGRDSVFMAHLFKQAGYTFGIAHCNFGLRGSESDQDEQFTRDLAHKFKVDFYNTQFDTETYASQHQLSIQMAARELRYQWLEEIRNSKGYQYIAVAHHQNDSIETMLLNLTRGTGIAGLHGIIPKRNKLIRPLLFLTREEIDQIILQEDISYREDASNESSKYARNKIRLEVIPKLKELNPKLEETFKQNIAHFADLEILLEQQVSAVRKDIFTETAPGEFSISLQTLKKLHPLKTLLFELFRVYGFTAAVLADLQKSWDRHPGKIFESNSHELLLDRDQLILYPKQSSEPMEVLIYPQEDEITWNKEKYTVRILPADNYQIHKSNNIAQIDFSRLQFPLKLRRWQEGDYFYPIGMSGKKKVSDFLIGQKIPIQQKSRIGILENGNKEIIWIAGHRLDDRYKVTALTEKVFILDKHKK